MMNLSLFSVYLISTLLLIWSKEHHPHPPTHLSQESSSRRWVSFKSKIQRRLSRIHFSKEKAALHYAYLTGQKKVLSSRLKKVHKKLNLLHLLTPSGLHLSSLLLFLKPLSRLNKKIFLFLRLTLLLSLFFLPQLLSLKRMAIFFLALPLKKKISIKGVFFLSMMIDLITGGFFRSPLSFTLSFLFLGTLICSDSHIKTKFFSLLMAQAILSFFLPLHLNGLGLILSQMITAIFSLFFPFMILALLTEGFPLFHLFFLGYFELLLRSFHLSTLTPTFSSWTFLFFALGGLELTSRGGLKRLVRFWIKKRFEKRELDSSL